MSKPPKTIKSGTIQWQPGEIPSVTGGKSPAMDFAEALLSGNPRAQAMAEQALREETSLADQFVAATYTLPKRLWLKAHDAKKIEPLLQSYRHDMRQAQRFVLDNEFVRYATEVSSTCKPEKLLYRVQFATMPYETTWIEFDLLTKVRTMRALHNMDDSKFKYDDVANRLGCLIRRLSDTEAVIEMICETHGNYGLIGTTICYFFSTREHVFTMTEGRDKGCVPMLPERADSHVMATLGAASLWGYSEKGKSTVIDTLDDMKSLRLPQYLLRHGALGTGRMRGIIAAIVGDRRNAGDVIADLIITETTEFTGMMRWIVTVLAMLNEVPVRTNYVQPMHQVRTGLTGKVKALDYHRVTLRLPKTKPVPYIERYLRNTSRKHKAHPVRSHWRTYMPDLPKAWCRPDEHDWTYDYEEGYRLCGKCMAYSRLIHEHVRGDPSLGWVHHDYVVKRSEQS
jgi:hypothetical protein